MKMWMCDWTAGKVSEFVLDRWGRLVPWRCALDLAGPYSVLKLLMPTLRVSFVKSQYMNVILSPSSGFIDGSWGLCGVMDFNDTNDYTGADGVVYDNSTLFADTWRVPGSTALLTSYSTT